jgi:hypothetical protein
VQNRLLAIYHQGVSCFMPALETHHGIGVLAQQINYLSLALITPLGAQHNNAFSHFFGNLG